jgi:ABC-type enterobactin transport system permease subunit
MFITKKHLSRRTLLKGAGVSLALPLLDAMIPAATALSQTAAAGSCAPVSFISLTAPSWATLLTVRRWISGLRRARAQTSSSARS